MLTAKKSTAEKRKELCAPLKSGQLLRFPGAFSPLVAMVIQRHGFVGVYVSSAARSADLGLLDIGLTTLSEAAARGGAIARAKAYVDAGADAIFPEALGDEGEFEKFRKAIKVPLLANMNAGAF